MAKFSSVNINVHFNLNHYYFISKTQLVDDVLLRWLVDYVTSRLRQACIASVRASAAGAAF